MFGIRLKILIGYTLLAVMLVSALLMIYDNTRSLTEVNRASEQLVKRRDTVDSLVCQMLETANAERAILLGNPSEWQRFDRALSASAGNVRHLRSMLADTLKRQRLDSLTALLAAKRENTLLVMQETGRNQSDAYYSSKVKALRSGRDSVLIHPQTAERHERQETVYEIVKSRHGFFRRLGDAFRRQHTDTVGTTRISRQPSTDTVAQRLNIADSVADVLAQIRREERQASSRRTGIMASRISRLQTVSVLLAQRTGQLLEDIQNDEHTALRQAVSRAVSSRRETIGKIAAFGMLAIISAAILLVYILRDIRRERRDRLRIVEANARTERLMQQRERLMLTITHDIKAPAASIAGFADLLAEHVDSPKTMGYVGNIASSARHLQQLVSALLDYHQLESGKTEMHETSFSPALLVSRTVDELQPIATERRLALRAAISPAAEGITCRTDSFRTKQILTNLISNALKYTDSGSVDVALAVGGGTMTMSVADTGRGMTADEQRRIFTPFTRLPDAQGREGAGLGLAITQQLVQMLSGRISVASEPGRGSKFTVCIPVSGIARDTAAAEAERGTAGAPPAAHAIKVVIVDDDRLQIQLLCELLQRLGGITLSVRHTLHASEAIDMIRRDRPHLLFTDVEMPEMNGADILRAAGGSGMKAVAMTAHEQSIMPQLRSQGFDACLFKPFSVQTLAATIARLTGIAAKPKDECCLARILAFADGDADAEGQIIDGIRASIDEYAAMLGDCGDAALTAKAAHKAMPLLEMLRPGRNEWLRPILPEHIDGTGADCRRETALRLKAELEQVRVSIDSLPGTKAAADA